MLKVTKSLYQYLQEIENSIFLFKNIRFCFSNQFYDKFLVDELQLYHVDRNDIQLVHISVGLD
jgi:hypothetical protein